MVVVVDKAAPHFSRRPNPFLHPGPLVSSETAPGHRRMEAPWCQAVEVAAHHGGAAAAADCRRMQVRGSDEDPNTTPAEGRRMLVVYWLFAAAAQATVSESVTRSLIRKRNCCEEK